uniref:Putative NnrS family protein n=1 Tax=Magnetococcus massalia (strain MO-1) TaxID=451514 RepID=A0A1S7LJ56_MAGMO|nr:putative NnrS family protein [Candidatus Magnetococcus massalia]
MRPLFQTPFRPFFLVGLLYATLSMGMWTTTLLIPTGWPLVPMLDGSPIFPVFWHAHEMIFGFCAAIGVGFLFTAAGNWFGKPLLTPHKTRFLLAMWLLGRLAVALVGALPPLLVSLLHGLFPLFALIWLAPSLARSTNSWHHHVLWTLGFFLFFQMLSLPIALELFSAPWATSGPKLGTMALLLVASVVGGRIIPVFTINWLNAQHGKELTYSPIPWLEQATLLLSLLVLAGLLLNFHIGLQTILLTLAGVAHMARMARWRGIQTGRAPIVWIMHLGYLSIPSGFLALAWVGQQDPTLSLTVWHIWTIGLGGLLLVGILTRVGLGHTGRPIHAHPLTVAAYLLLFSTLLIRSIWPLFDSDHLHESYWISGLLWVTAMLPLLWIYIPLMIKARADGKAG